MKKKKPNHWTRNIVIIVLIGAFVTVATGYFFALRSIETILREKAVASAQSWGEFLATSIDDIDAIAAGDQPRAESQQLLDLTKTFGDVFRYKIFSPDGHLVRISDDPKFKYDKVAELKDHNPTAADVLNTGIPFASNKRGDGINRPEFYAEAYVPLQRDGARLGTIEVYVDQTVLYSGLAKSLGILALEIMGAIAIAFAVPSAGMLLLSRRQARVLGRLEHVERHDGLTGVLTRATFTSQIAGLIESGERFTIHSIDLDRFQTVNNLQGLPFGDAMLCELTRRMETLTGPRDLIGRTGGDEFAVCIMERPGIEASAFAERLAKMLARPVSMGGVTAQISTSIGYADFPADGATCSEIIRAAEIALGHAVASGGGRAVQYKVFMDEERSRRTMLEARISQALTSGGFELFYQPLHDTATRRLRGFEALLRLRDAEGQFIPPSDFVPIAEQTGQIVEIGEWVLREACRTAAAWPEDLTVAVNLSTMQFETEKLVTGVSSALRESGLSPERLELEITETVLIVNYDQVIGQLHELRALGVRIALDDFGTGYSSLSYLWRFPFDKLKIDRSFISGLEEANGKSKKILKTIVSLGKTLNLDVTAEGVETEEQLRVLQDLNCDIAQGYLLGKPMPVDEIASFILNAKAPWLGDHNDIHRLRSVSAG